MDWSETEASNMAGLGTSRSLVASRGLSYGQRRCTTMGILWLEWVLLEKTTVRLPPDGSQGGGEGGTTATRQMQAGEGRQVLTRSRWGRRRVGSWLSATIFGSTVQEKLFEAAHPAE